MAHRNSIALDCSFSAGERGGRRGRALRALLCSSILTGSLQLISGAANAAACTGGANLPNSTTCINGSSAATLTYIAPNNPGYVAGDFTLRLSNHDVTAASGRGIGFSGVTGGNGVITLENDSDVVSGPSGYGIDAGATNSATTINVRDTSSVTGSVVGIAAESVGGDITINTAAGSTVSGLGAQGISAKATTTGDVRVIAEGDVSGAGSGFAYGISAASESGAVEVTTGIGHVRGARGVSARAVVGTAKITTSTGDVTGNDGDGILAQASGKVTVETHGDIAGSNNGIFASSTAGGNVDIKTEGSKTIKGTVGAGIFAVTNGAGTILVTNTAAVQGTDSGIRAVSAGGAIKIINNFAIANMTLDDAAVAINTAGGATTIDNNFVIAGRVITGDSSDVLNNRRVWVTESNSDFGGGSDRLNNSGIIDVGDEAGVAETTIFARLDNLDNNAGSINLSDQTAGDGSNLSDRLTTSGNYNGNGGALAVDAFLGDPGSLADVLAVGGNTTGVTRIFVTDTNTGPGAFNPGGILVVDVAGTSSAADFVLANGPIDKGMFFYDLLFDAGAGEHRLVGLPDREVFETLAAVASSQEIWRETTDAWSTRQENLRDVMANRQVVTGVADPAIMADDAPMGSLWASALGSWAERHDEASFSLLNGSFDFDTSYSQDIYGVVGGADFRADLAGDASALFGLMAGYIDSKLRFDESSTSIDSEGATVGAYASLMSGGFFANVLVKADLLTMDYTVGSLATDDNDDTNVRSYGVRGDLGYRFGDSLFVEPMLSVDAMSTKIDAFSVGGVDIDAGTNESFRGGAGIRAGYGGEMVRASAAARIWDVFATDNEVDVLAGVPLTLSDDDMEGVYGDVSGQVDVSLSTNMAVYLKGGILFSDDVMKPNASGGFAFTW